MYVSVGRQPSALANCSLVLIRYSHSLCRLLAGYFAWRNKANGSWFVQALHEMLEKFGRDGEMDFVRLLTRVNRKVAYEFESCTQDEFMNRKKQIPSIVSKLTKDIYLTPKK